MKTFQKPLTSEEEKFYLQEYQSGSDEAKDILIERNLRLVAHIVKKYQGLEDELDDLISIGTIGLIKAVMTFDSKKGYRLATYAARCIENEILMQIRSRKKMAKEISLYEPIGTDKEGNEINLMDIIEGTNPDIAESVIHKEEIIKLYKIARDILTYREYEVIKLRYGLMGEKILTQKETAKRLGISRSYVSRIEKTSLEKLRLSFLTS